MLYFARAEAIASRHTSLLHMTCVPLHPGVRAIRDTMQWLTAGMFYVCQPSATRTPCTGSLSIMYLHCNFC